MKNREVSLRGKLVRDMMKNMMDSAMGHKIQTGEYRKDPKEPAWICPPDYEYEIVEMPHFKMEYLRPTGVCTGRVILQLHGGGYIGPMKNIYRDFAIQYCRRSFGGDVLTIDYRVAPEHPYPAALEDAVAAYQWLIGEKHYDADKIVIAGDSAGGGLALVLVMYQTNFDRDPQFGGTTDNMLFHSTYIGDADPEDPYISPLFGDFAQFPPVLFQVGSEEVLLDDTLRTAEKVRKVHGKLRVTVYEGMFHVFQMALRLIPESREAWEEVSRFLEIIYCIERKKEGRAVKRVKSGRERSRREQ